MRRIRYYMEVHSGLIACLELEAARSRLPFLPCFASRNNIFIDNEILGANIYREAAVCRHHPSSRVVGSAGNVANRSLRFCARELRRKAF